MRNCKALGLWASQPGVWGGGEERGSVFESQQASAALAPAKLGLQSLAKAVRAFSVQGHSWSPTLNFWSTGPFSSFQAALLQ